MANESSHPQDHNHELMHESLQGSPTVISSTPSNGRKLYLESYGCQMNFSDSEIVASILNEAGFATTRDEEEADLILLNTCAIRENAEQRVRSRLRQFKKAKKHRPELVVGVLGYEAEMERSAILKRTSEGRVVAVASGVKLGRKRTWDEGLATTVRELREGGAGYGTIATKLGITASKVRRILGVI